MKPAVLSVVTALLLIGHAHAQPRNQLRSAPHRDIHTVSGYLDRMPRRVDPGDICSAAVGRFQYGVGGRGTGAVVVNPRVVLTNAHVVVHDGRVKPRVVFELPDGGVDYTAHWGTVAAQGTRYPNLHTNWKNDWALIVLDASAPVRPLPIIFESPNAAMAERRSLFTIGYSRFSHSLPGSGDFFAVVSQQCALRDYKAHMFLHDCSTMKGGSGSPILVRHGNYCAVVALHRGTMTQTSVEQVPDNADNLNYAVLPAKFAPALTDVIEQIKAGRWNAD
jgi:hypothetical protein